MKHRLTRAVPTPPCAWLSRGWLRRTIHALESEVAGQCTDAAATALAPRRDAGGPVCVAPGDAGCPVPPPRDAAPDPATWGCTTDSDCDVFPTLPFCDRRHCSAAHATVTCVANAPSVDGLPSPEVAHVFTGSNGTFVDRCDGNGNLIAYQCEMTLPPCDPAARREPNGCDFGPLVFTGLVIPNQDSPTVDCEGRCHDGRCDGRCPQPGDENHSDQGSKQAEKSSFATTQTVGRIHARRTPTTTTQSTSIALEESGRSVRLHLGRTRRGRVLYRQRLGGHLRCRGRRPDAAATEG